jgi:hypothetical protein
MNIVRSTRKKLRRVDVVTALHMVPAMVHLALVTGAGLLIIGVILSQFGEQLELGLLHLVFLAGYVAGDLVRLRFLRKVTISLGFPIAFLLVLIDSPFAAMVTAALGSLVSEALHNVFSKSRLHWVLSLRRVLFYAGHHAIAALGALLAYWSIGSYFDPWMELDVIHVQAALAYIVTYSLLSMSLVWPYDRQLQFFLAPEEQLVRIDLVATSLLLPIPVFVYYLLSLDLALRGLIVAGAFPLILVALFMLARDFTQVSEEQERLALGEKIAQRLGSPANMAEMAEQMLRIAGQLADYRWGAVYNSAEGELELLRSVDRPRKGPMNFFDPNGSEKAVTPGEDTSIDQDIVRWPVRVRLGEGVLGKLVEEGPHSRYFHRGLAENSTGLCLPCKTALIVLPITAKSQQEEKQTTRLTGLVALARPKRRFTTWDLEKGQALSNQAGNISLIVQHLEREIQELEEQIRSYAGDPGAFRQAFQELVWAGVDVSGILARVSDHLFRSNLRAVLRGVVEGQRSNQVSLTPERLARIYDQVRDETPGMPPLDPRLGQLLERVTSSLSLSFTFRYQFPDVERAPAFRELYRFLSAALDANTVSRILALDAQITSTVQAMRERGQELADTAGPPPAVVEEAERLGDIVHLLKGYEGEQDITMRRAALSRALELLVESEDAVEDRLGDPERFIFLQVSFGWRGVIANAMQTVGLGPARLKVRLRSQQALPLAEITVGLVLQNEGPVVASRVVVQLESSQSYEVLQGRMDVGTFAAGSEVIREFTLRPKGEGPLRLQFCITYDDPERVGKVERFAELLYLRETPPPFTEFLTPYTPGVPLVPGDATFVGREDIFRFIQQNIAGVAGKRVLALVGERRTGKTSILKYLPARLDSRYIPVFIDGQALGTDPGIGNFFLGLVTFIADGLEEFGIVVPRLTLAELGESPQHVFEHRFLPEVRRQIGDRILLLSIDEFERLGELVERGDLPVSVLPYLRHLIQHGTHLAFILAGTHKIEHGIGDYWSVLFNLAVYKKVGFLKREAAIRLITEPVQPHGMVHDDLAIDEILRLTACHPYFIQVLCNILVNQCNEAQRGYVTIQDVRNAVDELLEASGTHLSSLWGASNREARLVLGATAELQNRLDRVTAAVIADRLGAYQIILDPGQIIRAMEQLAARDVVHEIPGTTVSYSFTAQLYGHWLRRYQALSKVVEVMGRESIGE